MMNTRPAPYPADTRAKGWRLELDHERMDQSDTWALAGADLRPWLLMLWLVAWKQAPVASLPDDDAVIAAKLGMSAKAFAKARPVLMRGWWLADDGRLYHDVLAQRVSEMCAKKERDRMRKGEYRSRASADVPRDRHGTDMGQAVDGHGTDTDGHGSRGGKTPPSTKHLEPILSFPSEKKEPRKRVDPPPDCPESVSPEVWRDWLALRKAKKAPVTPTVVASALAEAKLAGMTLDAFLRIWCARGSQGLQAAWLKPDERGAGGSAVSVARDPGAVERSNEYLEGLANFKATAPPAAVLAMMRGAVRSVS
jgi:hypothetical protein